MSNFQILAALAVAGLLAFGTMLEVDRRAEEEYRRLEQERYEQCTRDYEERRTAQLALADSLVLNARSLTTDTGIRFDFSATAHNPSSSYVPSTVVPVTFRTSDGALFAESYAEIPGIAAQETVLFSTHVYSESVVSESYAELGRVGIPHDPYPCR